MNERWPHQTFAFEKTVEAINGGAKRICVTAPTGGGKTRCMIDILEWANSLRENSILYTNRRILLDQTKGVLESHGIMPGMRAAGYDLALLRSVQLAMSQTESSQSVVRQSRELHKAHKVLIDECHNQTGQQMQEIMRLHTEQGAVEIGYSATPLDLGDMFDELIVAATMSDCRKCGAVIPANTYAPDEPDLKHVKNYRVGEDLTEGDNTKAIMRPGVFGRVFDHWQRLNPDRKPTILFAPGVKESIWFAEQFTGKGIRAASIDGDNIWIDGEYHDSTKEARDEIRELSESGEVPVVCNRFVLREGVDWPHLAHGIFACVFGSLTSYLQSGGRLLRAYPGMDSVIVQDHGGNWWRHGSLNADREWSLGLTNKLAVGERIEAIRDREEKEPIVCGQCGKTRAGGKKCLACGHEHHGKSRMVVQIDGTLKEIKGDIIAPRITRMEPDTATLWRNIYFQFKNAGKTFTQAEGYFKHKNGYYPPRDIPNMPLNRGDMHLAIADVPWERMRKDPNWKPKPRPEPKPDPQTSMFGD